MIYMWIDWSLVAVLLVVFAIVLVTLYFLYGLVRTHYYTQAPYINSFAKHLRFMQQVKDQLPVTSWSKVLDLGCGDGKVLRHFMYHYALKKAVGYDINRAALLRWRIRNRLQWHRSVILYHGNLFQVDPSWYDVIYLYLFPQPLAQLEKQLFKQIDDHTVVICNTFPFPTRQPYSVLIDESASVRPTTLYLYKK